MAELILIYQDCALCGSKKEWGEAQLALAASNGQPVRKMSFVAEEAKGLCQKAVEAGIQSLPFFTDGTHFAKSVEEILAMQRPKKRAVPKKVKKEEKNGDLAES